MCTVSVIVPVYNVRQYLNSCIKSLINQTFGDIEVILVDDGSTDGSSEICDRWAIRDDRIKMIHQKNQGVSIARNNGLVKAVGEWVSFVDGDDYVAENMIEELLKEAKKSERTDLVIGSYYSVKDEKMKEEHFFEDDKIFNLDEKDVLAKMAVGIDVFGLKGKTNIGVPWSKLYRKRIVNEVRFQDGLKRMQDTIFNLSFFRIADEIRYIDIPLYYYRINRESVVRKYTMDFEDTAEDIIIALTKQLYMYDSINDKEKIIQFKKISLLIETIKLSYIDKQCKLSLKQKLGNIERLCESQLYYDAIHNNSDEYLSRKCKLLKRVLKLKVYWLVYILIYIKKYLLDNKL